MEKILQHITGSKGKHISKRDVIGFVAALLLGRAIIFNVISPFGLAYTAAYINSNKKKVVKPLFISAAAVLGAFLADMDFVFIKYMLAFVLFGFIYIGASSIYEPKSVLMPAFSATAAIFISGVIFTSQLDSVMYDWIMLALEAVLCFVSTLIMSSSLPLVLEGDGSQVIHSDSLIGFYLVGAVAVIGFTDLSIGGISMGNAFAALFIMLIAYAGGAAVGATGGICIGIIGSFAAFPVIDMIGVYGVCGLTGGIMSKYRRSGVILGFVIANSIISIYFTGFSGSAFTIFELAAACLLFCLMPKSVFVALETLIVNSNANNVEAKKAFNFLAGKLEGISKSFESLAKSFADLVIPKKADNILNLSVVFDETAATVCKMCGLKFICWKKEFDVTYDAFAKLAPILHDKNKIDIYDIDTAFSNKCIKINDMVKELNKNYAQFKIDMLWQQQVQEGRELVVNQLYGVSRLVENVALEMDHRIIFDAHLENRLIIELEKAEVTCHDINVVRGIDGRHEVKLTLKKCSGRLCSEKIAPIISGILGVRMQLEKESCTARKKCTVRFIEKEKITVECAGSKQAKKGEKECGDNFCCEQLSGGKYAVIISDGMGTGKLAARQSKTTIELLQQYLNAGFDKKRAVSMVNSALFMKTGTECSATIDATVFDLYSGVAEFIKIGANTGYIKRGKNIQKIASKTMPAGILKTVDAEIHSKTIHPGDLIALVSDGVHSVHDDWLPSFISKLPDMPAQEASDSILQEAIRRKDNNIDDDMTVVVAKICNTNSN